MKAKSRGQRRKKFQQPAQGKGTPGMTRLLCAQAPRTLALLSRSCRRRAGWWVALPPVLGFACILHSCSGLTSNCSSFPASPRRKGFPRVRDLVPSRGRSPSKSNETVISRSIWAKLIKGKAKESVCYRHCPCGSGRRSVERRQKQWSLVREVRQRRAMATISQEHRESNQRNPLAPI